MPTDRNEYMRQYRARKKAEAEQKAAEPEQTQTHDVAEQVVKRKRGLASASIEKTMTASPGDISRAIMAATRYLKADPVRDDDECAERINKYFADCAANGEIPKIENLSLCLGTTRQNVWNWANGTNCSAVRTRMIQRAKDILSAIDAELVATGKIPQVVYIFRAKNFYDMKDQQDVVVTPNNPLGDAPTTEQLTEKYSTLINIDDD